MLAIRMQRTGRKGHAHFRVVVQDSRQAPTSGRVVAQIGAYDPHTKSVSLEKEKAQFYINNGAQPSSRLAVLFKKEGIKLPEWVELADKKKSVTRNPEKLRKNRQAEPVAEESAPAQAAAAEASEAAPEATEAE